MTGQRVGILGAGQLGRMLALSGYPLGCTIAVLTPQRTAAATPVSEVIVGEFTDLEALRKLAAVSDVVTYESENIPAKAARQLAELTELRPGVKALECSQDRISEKSLFRRLGIPTVPFRPVTNQEDVESAVAELGLPAVLKSRRMGYDGKGQRVLRSEQEVVGAFASLGEVPAILEGFCAFRREVSLVAARAVSGQTVFYPLVENEHHNGILRRTWAPAPATPPELQLLAEEYVGRILDELDYVGVLAVEFFEDHTGLRANEMAPRTHNSGHWSIDGAVTCQFENHLRAICGYGLGPTDLIGPSCMINLLGHIPDLEALLAIDNAHVHVYGKHPRPGRKLGHVTVVESDPARLQATVERVEALVAEPEPEHNVPE